MTYVYDANGNIVSKTPYTNVTSSDLSTATQGTAIVYGYGDGNWSDKLTSYDGQTISYDASGNPTSYRGETVTWNGRLMTSFTKDDRRYEYSYNSDGMRTVKRVYEGDGLVYTFTYIWDGDVLLAGRMERPGDNESITIRYLYDDSGELYGMDYNGNGYFAFIKNLQGDIVSIVPLDSESNVEINMEYDAWGKPIIKQASSAAEGFLIAVMMLVTNVGYRGYFYDFETGLYYLRSRYYDPEIGRFINADDTAYLGYDGSPLSMNIFAYCENNPVNGVDYYGTFSKDNIYSLISTALNAAKKLASYLLKKVGVSVKGNYLYISSGTLAKTIDIAITAGSVFKYAVKKTAQKIASKALISYIKSNEKSVVNFLRNTVFPAIAKNMSGIIQYLFKIFAQKFAMKCAINYTSDLIKKRLIGNLYMNKWYNAFSSTGGMIAAFLDIIDGSWNGTICIQIRR